MKAIRAFERAERGAMRFRSVADLAWLLRTRRVRVGALLGRAIAGAREAPPWHCGVLVRPDLVVSLGLRGVVAETIEQFGGGAEIFVLRQADESAAARACSRLGQRLYHFVRFNCVHFVNWCAGV